MPGVPILIIDDEPGVLEGLRVFLEDEGYEVHEARGAKEGLDIFRAVKPDVVMTDLRMPGVSGTDLIKEIKQIKSHVPIIVVTGYGSLNTAIDAIRMHVFDFITKPVDLDSLKSSLDRARASIQGTYEVEQEMASLREEVAQLRKQCQGQLAKYAELEPLIQTGKLLAGVLHNLNNPLTFIMGQAELLQMLHPEVENVGAIKDQAVRMRMIISRVTQRMRQSQTRQVEWLLLNTVLQDEVSFLESHPYFRNEIEKEWHLDEELPPLRGVPVEFCQIFGNLLRNAAEAMKGQEVKKVTIMTSHDESQIHVMIRDTGPGIALQLKEKVFEPFFSTKGPENTILGGMGMGIGLYHCRELVARYGGSIEVDCGPGRGAAFVVHLPHGRENVSGSSNTGAEESPS